MVKPILCFLCGRVIRLTSFIENITNHVRFKCKVIFKIHVIALVFMCCGWSGNWIKTIYTLLCTLTHLGFLWDTLEGTIASPEYKSTRVENWAKQLIVSESITQESLEILVETLNSTNPAIWQAPLNFRAL